MRRASWGLVLAGLLLLLGAPAGAQDDPYPPGTTEGQYPPDGEGGTTTLPEAGATEPTAGEAAPTADESSILPAVLVVGGIVVLLAGGAWAVRRAT